MTKLTKPPELEHFRMSTITNGHPNRFRFSKKKYGVTAKNVPIIRSPYGEVMVPPKEAFQKSFCFAEVAEGGCTTYTIGSPLNNTQASE